MGEKQVFQPLTREDTITVVLYRIGIVIAAVIISGLAIFLMRAPSDVSSSADGALYALYASVGMSVFFIHLYVGKIKRYLKNLYYFAIGCLIVLLVMGKGAPSSVLGNTPSSFLLLLPLSGCLGFVTAKEAFCFKLFEGYLLAMLIPLYLLLLSGGVLSYSSASSGLTLIAVMLVVFTLRKVTMPLAYDIGDKSAYQ